MLVQMLHQLSPPAARSPPSVPLLSEMSEGRLRFLRALTRQFMIMSPSCSIIICILALVHMDVAHPKVLTALRAIVAISSVREAPPNNPLSEEPNLPLSHIWWRGRAVVCKIRYLLSWSVRLGNPVPVPSLLECSVRKSGSFSLGVFG